MPRILIHCYHNRHGSAQAALDYWTTCGFWSNPIRLGPDKFHCYGASKKSLGVWRPLNVEFTTKRIVVVRTL